MELIARRSAYSPLASFANYADAMCVCVSESVDVPVRWNVNS